MLLVFDLIKNQEKKIQKYKRIHMNNAHKIAYVSGEEPKWQVKSWKTKLMYKIGNPILNDKWPIQCKYLYLG